MYKQYRYKFYLNANHFIKINGKDGQIHPHTWEIAIDLLELDEGFTEFSNVEKIINTLIDGYQDKVLNDIPPFNTLNPTLENICIYFRDLIEENMINVGYLLLTIEISETPTRSFIINLVDNLEDKA